MTLPPPPAGPADVVRIRPHRGWQPVNFRDLWRYRELLVFLALRDVRVRYKQTALGVSWAVIQPLFNMVVFTVFFGNLAGLDKRTEAPYPVFILAALLPWQLFSYALTQASNSLVSEQRLISKVYFPRLIVPLASVGAGLADFAVAFLLLGVGMACYGLAPGWGLVAVPALTVLALLAATAVALWLAALNVQYRDVRYTLPFVTQLWMFVTPVLYPSSMVPEAYRTLYGLNPMAGVVEGFRWALLGTEPPGPMFAVSVLVTLGLLVGGVYYFRRVEQSFADVV